jgi:hypothetical protein
MIRSKWLYMLEVTNENTIYFETAIGDVSTNYYINEFKKIYARKKYFRISWNWSAFFFSAFWFLYRKTPIYVILYWSSGFLLGVISDKSNDTTLILLYLYSSIAYISVPLFANYFYYIHISNLIKKAKSRCSNESDCLRFLKEWGGVGFKIS